MSDLKRRGFLKGLLGTIVATPVVVAATEVETDTWDVETDDWDEYKDGECFTKTKTSMAGLYCSASIGLDEI
jgi:hypothetical protein